VDTLLPARISTDDFLLPTVTGTQPNRIYGTVHTGNLHTTGDTGPYSSAANMSSSIFFKFKSQKEPSQITFDGTSLSVFEVKREIIAYSKLGDGTDFDLEIYTSDTNEREYHERTTWHKLHTDRL